MPQASSLRAHNLGVTYGPTRHVFQLTIVVPLLPKYQLGTGDPLNVVDRDNGLPFIVSGVVGSSHRILASRSNLPSTSPFISLGIGNNFTQLNEGATLVIPAAGWLELVVPTSSLADPGPAGKTFYSQTFEIAFPTPLDVSNVQSMILVQ